jgi:hypothetical protein
VVKITALDKSNPVEVTIDTSGTIKVKINTIDYYVNGTQDATSSGEDTADVWNKATPTIVSAVECVDDEIQVTSSGATEYLTPP